MRTWISVLVLVLACCVGEGLADDKAKKLDLRKAVFKELLAKLPKGSDYFNSARLELEFWYYWPFWQHQQPERTFVMTKEGKNAEVIFLTGSANCVPGTDFSLAFLLVEQRVVDWASCRTKNRFSSQKLLLEDVDGDGFLDVSFCGIGGQHRRPDGFDDWHYAYAITTNGFKSLFPGTDYDLKVKVCCHDPTGQGVKIDVEGVPAIVRERRMIECIVTATNTSKNMATVPKQWSTMETENAYWCRVFCPPCKNLEEPAFLKPGRVDFQNSSLLPGRERRQRCNNALEFRLPEIATAPKIGRP